MDVNIVKAPPCRLSFRSRNDQHVIDLHIHRPGRYAVQAWTETPNPASTLFALIARADETRLVEALRKVKAWRALPPEASP